MPPTKRRASVAAAMAEAAAMDGYDDLRPSKHAGVKRLSDELTCEICEGVLRDPATLPCCHTFCLACVKDKLQGHGVYESKCPQCGMPLHFKDLRVNQTYNGVIEQIESALARFAAESARGEEKDADAPNESARTPESDASLALAVPTPARCRELASDVRSIDAALAFLAARLETAKSANEKRKRETAPAPRDANEAENENENEAENENVRSASETLPSPTPIYVSYRDTQNTDPNATFRSDTTRARGSRASLNTPRGAKEKEKEKGATVSVAATSPLSPPSPPRVASAAPRQSRVRRLTAPQARRLYAAAHGKPPPKRLTHALKKLLAELEKLDEGLVEQLIEIALRDERDDDDDDAASSRAEKKKRKSEPPDAATTRNAEERDGRATSRSPSRVFAYACAAPSASSRSASLGGAWGKRKAAALAEAVARANDATGGGDPTGIEPATAADPAEGFPARATHLLMDPDETNTRVHSRTVKYLEAVARGAWVLPFSYLERCAEAGRWLPERDFELEDLGRGHRAEDGSWVAPGPDDDEARDETKALAVFGVGPAGGRRRVAAGAPGAFAGEVVAVASAPARLLVVEMERLLLAGGAEAVLSRAPGALGRGTPRAKENENENEVSRFCETEVPESVPDSQASAEEEMERERFGWAEGATAVVDGGDGSGVAVGRALGVPVVDWHWVFHSLVYHAPLPKKEYEAVESAGTRENQT